MNRPTAEGGATVPSSTVRVVIYARVSTTDQNCEMQVRELREYASRRGWHISGEYLDTGWSGAKANRPELDRLMQDAALRRFDAVLVWKLDRFGRSVRNCLDGIESLRSYGVRFLAVSQSIDTDESNPTSRLLLHILASVAEFEREMIRERVCAGVRNAKRKGVRLGRRQVVFDRSRATRLHEGGASVREIASSLRVGRGTVHRFLLSQKPSPDATLQPAEKWG
jgi:putative DNA-invertase from lambdoid prophage Rac